MELRPKGRSGHQDCDAASSKRGNGMSADENVLVIPAKDAEEFTKESGLKFRGSSDLEAIFNADTYLPRSIAENDPTHLQIIPYVVFIYRPKNLNTIRAFAYRRGAQGGESRLHAKWSVGIGGHVNDQDGGPFNHLAFSKGMWREVNEEVRIVDYVKTNYCGTIYDPSTEVGRVHLGVLQVIELLDGYIVSKDPSIVDAQLFTFGTLLSGVIDFEPWSQMVINGLFAILNGTKAPSP